MGGNKMVSIKKLLASSLVSILCLSNTNFVKGSVVMDSIESNPNFSSVYIDSNDKKEFAAQMDNLYLLKTQKDEIKLSSTKNIENLMLKAAWSDDDEKELIYQQLSNYGCYVMSLEDSNIDTNTTKMMASSGTNDVTISTPTIYYNAYNKTWTVTCGGQWNTTAWNKLLPGDVGGQDGFGVGYTNTSSSYNSSVISCSAYITDRNRYVSTSYRSDGDGSKGFGFRLQDYIYTSDFGYTNHYVGAIWCGLCNYDSYFSTYSGVATAYYIHTYSSASLSGVQFGVSGKTAGIEASISSKSDSFTGFSSDKRFGVY